MKEQKQTIVFRPEEEHHRVVIGLRGHVGAYQQHIRGISWQINLLEAVANQGVAQCWQMVLIRCSKGNALHHVLVRVQGRLVGSGGLFSPRSFGNPF